MSKIHKKSAKVSKMWKMPEKRNSPEKPRKPRKPVKKRKSAPKNAKKYNKSAPSWFKTSPFSFLHYKSDNEITFTAPGPGQCFPSWDNIPAISACRGHLWSSGWRCLKIETNNSWWEVNLVRWVAANQRSGNQIKISKDEFTPPCAWKLLWTAYFLSSETPNF